VNILANDIRKEQAEDLIKIMKRKASLKSLCGIKPDQREADFSGQMLEGVDAMLIANDISDNGALTSLDISDNKLARGAYKGGDTFDDASYETDTTGMRVCVAPKLFSDAMTLQVLQPLPMPSVTMGR
jgi:hypothetical protein